MWFWGNEFFINDSVKDQPSEFQKNKYVELISGRTNGFIVQFPLWLCCQKPQFFQEALR